MSTNNRIKRNHLDTLFDRSRAAIPQAPSVGWINEIRTALSMPLRVLGKKLKLDTSTVSRLELSEKNKTITLGTLERVATALGCKVHYMLIPDETLNTIVHTQGKKSFEFQNKKVKRTMILEDQKPLSSKESLELAHYILNNERRIWDTPDED